MFERRLPQFLPLVPRIAIATAMAQPFQASEQPSNGGLALFVSPLEPGVLAALHGILPLGKALGDQLEELPQIIGDQGFTFGPQLRVLRRAERLEALIHILTEQDGLVRHLRPDAFHATEGLHEGRHVVKQGICRCAQVGLVAHIPFT